MRYNKRQKRVWCAKTNVKDGVITLAKVEIEVFANSGARAGEKFLAADSFGRLRMSSGLVAELSLEDRAGKFYLGYDKGNKRIALGPVGVVTPTDANPVTFDKSRHYASVRAYFNRYGIAMERVRYVFDGKHDGWLMFRREGFEAGDRRAT